MKRLRDYLQRGKQNRLLNGAVVLTLAALVTKVLSAGYRIPYHYIAGDVGFYIYQQIYPFYGLAVLFSTYGFPVIISKLIAERASQFRKGDIEQIIKISFLALFGLNFLLFLLQYAAAQQIAVLMGDEKLTLLIKIVSFSFLLTPFIAVARGYYQGQNNMVPTAVSQVMEQVIRVLTILLFSYVLLKSGYGLYEAGAGAAFGSLTGGFSALVILLYFAMRKLKKWFTSGSGKASINNKTILKTVLLQGILVCISSMGILILQFIDSFTLYSQLVKSGIDAESAKIAKGVYDRGLPLIQLGTVVGTAFSLSMIPLISNAVFEKNNKMLREKTELSIRLSAIVGIGAVLGLIGLIKPTNIMLYGDSSGTSVLKVFCIVIVFAIIVTTTGAILQGIGHASISAVTTLAGMGVKWLLNIWLVSRYGITGAAWASVISFALIAILNLMYLYKKLKFPLFSWRCLAASMTAGMVMVFVLIIYTKSLELAVSSLEKRNLLVVFEALSGVLIGGLIYLWLVLYSGIFSKKEVLLLPYGEKLSKWVKS